jgi:hypothetical protein
VTAFGRSALAERPFFVENQLPDSGRRPLQRRQFRNIGPAAITKLKNSYTFDTI